MSTFTTPLEFRALGTTRNGREEFVLTREFCYEVGVEGSGACICAPAGFVTDFASIPWPLRLVLRPQGMYAKAAVIHDILYESGLLSRDACDMILLEGMRVLGVNPAIRFVIYNAVRLFGNRSFKRKTASPLRWRTAHTFQ